MVLEPIARFCVAAFRPLLELFSCEGHQRSSCVMVRDVDECKLESDVQQDPQPNCAD